MPLLPRLEPGCFPAKYCTEVQTERAGFTDESVIRFDAASTFSFDDDFDAVKMEGTGNAPSDTEEQDGVKMAVDPMPSLHLPLDIPIEIVSIMNPSLNLVLKVRSSWVRLPSSLRISLLEMLLIFAPIQFILSRTQFQQIQVVLFFISI